MPGAGAERKNVNLYFWLIIVVSIMIMISGFVRGYHRGFVKELEGLVAAIFAVISLVLISGLVRGTIGEIKLFAGLPVISFADGVLGLLAGGAKAFMLLYIVDHVAKIWLNL